jgi:hypothetical protein
MRRKNFKLWFLSFLTGATAFQFSGCDPTIKDTLFQGIQTSTVGLMTTFINALFLAIRPDTQETTTTTTKAVVERLIDTLC